MKIYTWIWFLIVIGLNQIIFNRSSTNTLIPNIQRTWIFFSFDSNVHRFLGFQGDDFWSRGRSIPPFPIKPSMTSCPAKRPRVTNSRAELRHSRRPVKLAPPATLPKSHFPLPSNSDSSHRLRVFNAFIIPDLMIPGPALLSPRIYYKLNTRQYSWNNIINRIGIILFDRVNFKKLWNLYRFYDLSVFFFFQ